MIERVAELNRVLVVLAQLAPQAEIFDRVAVVDACKRTVIEGRIPDHEKTLEFAASLGLVTLTQGACGVTGDGQAFLSLNPAKGFDLTDDQKRVLVRSHYLGGVHRRTCKDLFSSFAFSEMQEAIRWSAADSKAIVVDRWLIDHLCQLGALLEGEGWLQVHPEYTKAVAAFVDEEMGLTEEKLQEILKEKEEVGVLAEQLVLEYERQRLRNAGYVVEASCVRRVSRLRVNAGFDIESFNGKSPDLVFDRFIEVKGAKGRDVRFFWSANEIKVAANLRDRYWIYFQGGVNLKLGMAKDQPVCFEDPHFGILGDGRLTTTSQGLLVEGAFRGTPR
jgi:hypothetical protein